MPGHIDNRLIGIKDISIIVSIIKTNLIFIVLSNLREIDLDTHEGFSSGCDADYIFYVINLHCENESAYKVIMTRSTISRCRSFLISLNQHKLQPATHNISFEAVSTIKMAPSKKPNDYLVSELLAKQANRDCGLEKLLQDIAQRNYSALSSSLVEFFNSRINELRYRIRGAYSSRKFDIRTFDVLVGSKCLGFCKAFMRCC